MEFLTLHELSLQFDIPVRVLRHRLRLWLQSGEFVEGVDCRRDDYVDETHFVWRINPLSFIRVTGRQPVTKLVNQTPPAVTQTANTPPPPPAPQPYQTLPSLDKAVPGMEREMIDLLKDQVRAKDGQIIELTGQTKTLTALNEKLTGVMVHQTEQIKNLLQLTGGKTELDDLVTKPVNTVVTQDPDLGANGQPMGNQAGNQEEGREAAA